MDINDVIENINKSLIKLWKKGTELGVPHDMLSIAPLLLYKEDKDLGSKGLLFIGLNPSYSLKGFNQALHDTRYKDLTENKINEIHEFSNITQYKDDIINIHKEMVKSYKKYFKPFENISNKYCVDWKHVDLFFVRETSQNKIKDILKKWDKNGLPEFFKSQIKLSFKLIISLNPKVIVVANALASDILQDKLKDKIYDLNFNEDKGFHEIKLNGKEVPIFFTSMLTGGHLDQGSFKRLEWHIGQALRV